MKHVLCLNRNIMVSVMVSSSTLEIMWLPWAAWPSVQIKRHRHACVCVCVCVVCVCVWSDTHFLWSAPYYSTSLCCHIIHTHKRTSPRFEADRVNEKCNWCIDLTFVPRAVGVYVVYGCRQMANVCTCAILFHKINMSVKMMWISSSWAHWPVYVQ